MEDSWTRLNGRLVNKRDDFDNNVLIVLCSLFHYSDDLLVVGDMTMIVLGYCILWFIHYSDDLLVVRDMIMILLEYSGFLRYNELSSLKCKDINLFDGYIKICIYQSKTDQ